MRLRAVADTNNDVRNQKYRVPNLGCRPGAFTLSIAIRPVAAVPMPSRTWTATIERKRGSLDGMTKPPTVVVSPLTARSL
jgi:hypothetical protein